MHGEGLTTIVKDVVCHAVMVPMVTSLGFFPGHEC